MKNVAKEMKKICAGPVKAKSLQNFQTRYVLRCRICFSKEYQRTPVII